MAFDMTFPYTDMHTLNLDWILRKLKELENGETVPVDVSELEQKIRNLSVCQDSGTGILTLDITNVSGMQMSPLSRVYREKTTSSFNVFIRFLNNTGSDLAANVALVTFDSVDLPFNIYMNGCVATIHRSDGTELVTTPLLYYDNVLEKAAIQLDGYGIQSGATLEISGISPLSSCGSKIICRARYNAAVAGEILSHMLYGTTGDSWQPGNFTYSQDAATRLDPSARATDCSGMIYIAFKTLGMSPGRGDISHSYLSDGMVLAYADVDEDLDLSNARPGDIIIYHAPGDKLDITHCTLYAGNDVTYEMAYTYPDPEQAAGCVNGQGPYAITSTPAHAYRKDSRGRYLIRVL